MKTAVAIVVLIVGSLLAMGYGSSFIMGGIEGGMHSNKGRYRSSSSSWKGSNGSLFSWKKSKRHRSRR